MSPVAIVFLLWLFLPPIQNKCSDEKPKPDTLNVEEKQALVSFFCDLDHKIYWNLSKPACSWKGVNCDPNNKTVFELHLPRRSIIGEIPNNTIGRLTNLRILSLRYNAFSGDIPPDFSKLTSLRRLSLTGNNFTGQFPCIKAKNLRIFNISFNKFNTSVPSSLSKFRESAFSNNVFLCGHPEFKNNGICPSSYPTTWCPINEPDKTPIKMPEILGISVAGGMLLLTLLSFIRKKVQPQDVQKPRLPNSPADVVNMIKTETVVPLTAYYYSTDEKMHLYHYMPSGSLYDRLHGSTNSVQMQLDWDHCMRIAHSAARELKYLHGAGKVHGNIKSSNILFRQETNNEASLSDYGLNMLLGESSSLSNHGVGYWAPELPNNQKVTFKTDVYSFGVLLLELLTSQNPEQDSFSKLVESVAREEPKAEILDVKFRKAPNVEDEMMQLLGLAKKCLSSVPDERPTMDEVVRMMEDMLLRQSSDDHSKGYDDTPSTYTQDTPSMITITL